MQYSPPDVPPALAARQNHRYREMTAAEKLTIADGIWDLVCEATKAGVRMRNPALDEATVEVQARTLIRDASD